MNDAELNEVVREGARWTGEPLTGIWQPARDRVVLGLGAYFILLVPRGPFARLHEVRARPTNPPRPFSFQGAGRAHLFGTCTGVVQHPGDRVVDLCFGRARLHLRLTGRSGGLWLFVEDRVVAAYDGPAPASLPALPAAPARRAVLRFEPKEGEGWSSAAARWFAAEERRHADRERRHRLTTGLVRETARLERLLSGLNQDLEHASTAPRLRRMADALAANLHRVTRGTTSFTVPDLEDPGILHAISIDPGQSPVMTMERLYSKARRLDRSGDRILENLEETWQRLERVRAAASGIAEATVEELAHAETLLPKGQVGSGSGRRRTDAVTDGWWTWTGPGGQTVLVGRNEKGNRQLTFQKARGDDFWMHLRGRPGAHIVLPSRGHPPPLDVLLCAAQIALVHGKVPEGTAADVHYTRVRNIRSIPGEIALVQVHDEKVLHVVRDPEVLRGWGREGE